MKRVYLDFEFTALPDSGNQTPEILETKIIVADENFVVENEFSIIHKTKQRNTVGSYLVNHILGKDQTGPFFSKKFFYETLESLDIDPESDLFLGFSVDGDLKLLSRYGIKNLSIEDISKNMRKTEEYEFQMAAEGSSMEACYIYCTKDYTILQNHKGTEELYRILAIDEAVQKATPIDMLTVVPFGKERGMPISDYVKEYRRKADGYRFNNEDDFSESLTYHIENLPVLCWNDQDFYC